MAFTVKFYSFAKKENSTAQPTGGTEYDCQIKRESGILNPEIILNIGLTGAPAGWNYAYIADFSRYYFIREWINEGPIWRALMQCDVLASYKSAIGGSTLYALRSSYSYDGDIVDALYPCKAKPTFSIIQNSPPFRRTPTTGLFVCGIVANAANAGDTTAQIGSLKYYYLDLAGLATLCDYLLTTSNYSGILDLNDCSLELQKSLIDPLQYIKSCVWIPANATDLNITLSNQTIYINGWNVPGIHSAPISNITPSGNITVTIPAHPDAASRGGYMNMPPYTGLSFTVPPYGDFEADASLLAGETSIYLNEFIDVTNGKGILDIMTGTNTDKKTIAHLSAMRGVNIQLSQITTDYIGATTSAVGGIAGAIGSAIFGDIAGAIGSAVGGIANAAKAAAPKVSTMGGGGSFLDNFYDWYVVFKFMRPVDDDNSHHGRPLCKSIQISNYPGYLLIQDADIAINATADELQKIRGYLEGGFYYE